MGYALFFVQSKNKLNSSCFLVLILVHLNMSNKKNEKMGPSEITKVAQRNNKGIVTGTVYVLETINNYLGRHYIFSMTAGEFGETLSRVSYRRLPKKIKNLFA